MLRCEGATLVSVLLFHDDENCLEHDLQIQPDGPLANVAVIEFNSISHFLGRVCFPSASADLCKSGYARLHLVTQHEAWDLASKLLIVSGCQRSWTNERHGASKDVEQLGQFIQGCFS